MLTNAQYALILNMPFVYPTHPGPLIIPDGTTAHTNSNTRISHTEEVRIFREVTWVEQALAQQIVATVKEAYLTDIWNCTTDSINDTVADVITHPQEKYGQLIPHELLERKDIIKTVTYHPQEPITAVFSAVKELLKFSNITGTSCKKHQALKITYVIIHRTGKFGLEISKWNCMLKSQKTWVWFKHFFRTAHQELRETTDLTVQDSGMNHANMVRDVVAGPQGVLQQDQSSI